MRNKKTFPPENVLKHQIDDAKSQTAEVKRKSVAILGEQQVLAKQNAIVSAERDGLRTEVKRHRSVIEQHEVNHERFVSVVASALPGMAELKDHLVGSARTPEQVENQIAEFRDRYGHSLNMIRDEAREQEAKQWDFRLRAAEESFQHELLLMKEERGKMATEHERSLSETAVEAAELRGKLNAMEEKHRDQLHRHADLQMEHQERGEQVGQLVVWKYARGINSSL